MWATLPDGLTRKRCWPQRSSVASRTCPGTAFYPDGRGRNQMRLAFCYPTEDRIREGIARLGSLLEDEEQLYRSLHP